MPHKHVRVVLSGCHRLLALATVGVGLWLVGTVPLGAQQGARPFAVLTPALADLFPNATDSNSPAVWEVADGRWSLTLFNSFAGQPHLSEGTSVRRLTSHGHVTFSGPAPEQGVWFESVIRDTEAWYAFYHNERADVVCPGSGKVWPRIGAARSVDHGVTWVDLGPVLETAAASADCGSANHFFVGGVGDFSVRLDPDHEYLYLYYSQYAEAEGQVGVAVARMAWADRDAPAGRMDVWADGAWVPPSPVLSDDGTPVAPEAWSFPAGTPVFRAVNSWDDRRPGVDAFWGPSIHWNTSINTWVMLLNQAVGTAFEQGGVWISFNDRLDDPAGWSAPTRLLEGGRWYPQVVGLDPTLGTDALAGALARFYMAGRSDHYISFGRR